MDDIGPVNDENDLVQVTVSILLMAGDIPSAQYPGEWRLFSVMGEDKVTASAYQWWVRGWTPDGTGPWSAEKRFTIP